MDNINEQDDQLIGGVPLGDVIAALSASGMIDASVDNKGAIDRIIARVEGAMRERNLRNQGYTNEMILRDQRRQTYDELSNLEMEMLEDPELFGLAGDGWGYKDPVTGKTVVELDPVFKRNFLLQSGYSPDEIEMMMDPLFSEYDFYSSEIDNPNTTKDSFDYAVARRDELASLINEREAIGYNPSTAAEFADSATQLDTANRAIASNDRLLVSDTNATAELETLLNDVDGTPYAESIRNLIRMQNDVIPRSHVNAGVAAINAYDAYRTARQGEGVHLFDIMKDPEYIRLGKEVQGLPNDVLDAAMREVTAGGTNQGRRYLIDENSIINRRGTGTAGMNPQDIIEELVFSVLGNQLTDHSDSGLQTSGGEEIVLPPFRGVSPGMGLPQLIASLVGELPVIADQAQSAAEGFSVPPEVAHNILSLVLGPLGAPGRK